MRTFSLIIRHQSGWDHWSHKLKIGLKCLLLQGKVLFQTLHSTGGRDYSLMLHTSSQKLSAELSEGWSVLSVSKQTHLRHKTRVADMLQQLSADWNWVAQAWTPHTTVLPYAGAKPMACWQVLNLETPWQVCWHKSAHSTFQTQKGAKVHQPQDQTQYFNTTKNNAS